MGHVPQSKQYALLPATSGFLILDRLSLGWDISATVSFLTHWASPWWRQVLVSCQGFQSWFNLSWAIQKVHQELNIPARSQPWTLVLSAWPIAGEGIHEWATLTQRGLWSLWVKVSGALSHVSVGMTTPAGHAFYKLCHCEDVRTCIVVSGWDEESEVKCFAQGHGAGKWFTWDHQQALLTPNLGLVFMLCDGFHQHRGLGAPCPFGSHWVSR